MAGSNSSWVSWRVKEGRPSSIPGYQNTEALPCLPDANFDCGEGNFCCYYQCRKCLYELVLGSLNIPKTRIGLTFIPEISCIEPKKENALFEMDYGYHGEVSEFCTNYLSRMENLQGFAVNGWNNREARKILKNVEKTFYGTKHSGSNDFEIDWLIFEKSTLVVAEVGVRGKSEDIGQQKSSDPKEKCGAERQQNMIKKKISQVLKDEVIISHLLEATGCCELSVIYLAVFPNLPLEELESVIYLYRSSLRTLTATDPLK